MKKVPTELFFGIGLIAMLIALVLQNVTLTNGRYGSTLVSALVFTALADFCLTILVWRGGWVWRSIGIATMLPTVFVVLDFLRRAPATF